ncbi:MAG TPA: hypothetical protein VIW68_11885 [Candidatus Sulfotelmatobacter sp.]
MSSGTGRIETLGLWRGVWGVLQTFTAEAAVATGAVLTSGCAAGIVLRAISWGGFLP